MSETPTATGSCLCGQLTFEVDAPPAAVWTCHCTDCQQVTGSDYQLTVLWNAEKFRHKSGRYRIWRRPSDSGRSLKVYFCPDCGSRVFYHIDGGSEIMFTPSGVVDQKQYLVPVANLWTRSARPWVNIDPDLLNFETQPEGEGFLPLFAAYANWLAEQRLAA